MLYPAPVRRAVRWCSNARSGQPVTATIDAAKTGPPISPYVYGQFLEHAGSLIYSSLWCEMLDDRKFYYAVTTRTGRRRQRRPARRIRRVGPGRRNVGPGRWNPIGPVDSVVMDTNNPFVGDHTPLIKLAGAEPRGIRQTGINFTQGATYNGRIQLAGDPGAKVSINIVWGTNADAVRQTVPLGKLGKDYKKFTFSFKAENSGTAQFEISRHRHRLLPRRRGFAHARRQPRRLAPRRHRRSQKSSLRRLSFPRRQFRFRP